MRHKKRLSPEETVGFLLWDTTRAFTSEFSTRIARHGVSFGLWPFLRELWEHDGLTQSELSRRVHMKGPTTVAAINRLERAGMVRRVQNKGDGRKINVFLTEKGRRTYDVAMPEVEDINRVGLARIGARQQTQLKRMLKRIRANLRVEP
jgi:DNA-binding MarR family transcriptional regulator